MFVAFVVAEVVFYVLIGSLSAYLSWSSNAYIGWNPVFCFIFALFSFIFAGSYLLGHVIFKLDLLAALREFRRAVVPSVSVPV